MCTVLFIPANNRLYFASLRDESPNRPLAFLPEIIKGAESDWLAPLDAQAGGSWVGVNTIGNVLILLNGGFENHQRALKYRKSRGLIIRELLQSAALLPDWEYMLLDNIEPFTIVSWTENALFQLVWDGFQKHCIQLNTANPFILSSSTLYTPEAKKIRQHKFEDWLKGQPSISQSAVFDFLNSYTDLHNGFIMNRNNKIRTLSYSFIELVKQHKAEMYYQELPDGRKAVNSIEFISNKISCNV